MTYYEQDQIDQRYVAEEAVYEAAARFRYHLVVDSLEDDEAHVLDTMTGKTLLTGTVGECQDYLQLK